MLETIVDSFDIWGTAQTQKSKGKKAGNDNISFHGINRLRELILELAVRGKLIEQDPNDEHTNFLLQRIETGKDKLKAVGLLKKQNPLPEITKDEKLFELPKGWAWSRLGTCSYVFSGASFKSEDFKQNGSVRAIKITNAGVGKFIETDDFLPDNFIREYHNFIVKENDLILALTRPYISTGLKISKCPTSYNNSLLNQRVAAIRTFIDTNFLFIYLSSNIVLNKFKERFGKSGLQPNLKMSDVTDILVPIAPIQEQHRIVAKVYELMALCDKLEQEQMNHIETHLKLVEALLQTLTDAKNAEELKTAWQHLEPHFDILFTTEESVELLKQTILQLAVMGKLVPQNPNDEPASVLLKKIAAEKQRLIKEGKLKKQKPLPEITEEEKPFELPEGWEFARLLNISELITKGSSPKWQGVSYTENQSDVLFITSENVGSYELLLENKKYVEQKFNEIEPRSVLRKGDFLMNIVGASIGRTAVFDIEKLANINQAVCLIRAFTNHINENFLLNFFNSEICVSYMFDKQVDNARANLSMGNISKFMIPIPPQNEQLKIVERLEELMTLCNQLKERIIATQELKVKLADAVVEQAVN